MKERNEKITTGEAHLGKVCVSCNNTIESHDEVVVCPRCHTVQHADCWKKKGGCGKASCPQLARAVLGERSAGDGPPPPVSKKTILLGTALSIVAILLMIFWPKPPDPAMGRVKIVFLGEAYHELTVSMTKLADDYNAISEDIYIDLQLLPPGSMDQKLVVLIAAGQAPDVIAIDYERFAYFTQQGVLLSLGENETGQPVYGVQHPGQLSQLVVWGATDYPTQALEVLRYFADQIPPADLDRLRELNSRPLPLFGS